MEILRLIRIKHWVKNLFVLLPLFFAAQFTDLNLVIRAGVAFFSFCLAASAVYIFNDLLDINSDRQHPVRKNRPLAKESISKGMALAIFSIFSIGSAVLLVWLNDQTWVVLVVYFVMNLAYSIKLKHIPILDIVIVSIGFILRILAGGFSTDIPISEWLILLTFLLAMILVIGKRRDEFINSEDGIETRQALRGYNLAFLDSAMIIMSAVTLVSYIMYTISPEVTERIGSNHIYYTTIFVIVGILRYLQQTIVQGKTTSPTKFLYSDIFIQVTLILWVGSFIFLIYY